MGQVKASDIITELPTPLYYFELYWRGMSDRDISSIEQKLRYYQQRYYPFASWAVAGSETEGDSAGRTKIKDGSNGKPRTVVKGNAVDRHVHIMLIGDETRTAHSFARKVKDSLDKTVGKKIGTVHTRTERNYAGYKALMKTTLKKAKKSARKKYAKQMNTRAPAFIAYCYQQAYRFRTGGRFNWLGCTNADFFWAKDGLWKDGVSYTKTAEQAAAQNVSLSNVRSRTENSGGNIYLTGNSILRAREGCGESEIGSNRNNSGDTDSGCRDRVRSRHRYRRRQKRKIALPKQKDRAIYGRDYIDSG
jgi:hypothetical protein